MSPFQYLRQRFYDARPHLESNRPRIPRTARNPPRDIPSHYSIHGESIRRPYASREPNSACSDPPLYASSGIPMSPRRQSTIPTQSPSNNRPCPGEKYIFTPDSSHIRIPVYKEVESLEGIGLRRAYVAIVPAWASIHDVCVCLAEGEEVGIFVRGWRGELIDVGLLADVRELQEFAALVIFVPEGRGGRRYDSS